MNITVQFLRVVEHDPSATAWTLVFSVSNGEEEVWVTTEISDRACGRLGVTEYAQDVPVIPAAVQPILEQWVATHISRSKAIEGGHRLPFIGETEARYILQERSEPRRLFDD